MASPNEKRGFWLVGGKGATKQQDRGEKLNTSRHQFNTNRALARLQLA